jgi:hypothetical protein
MTTPVDAGSSGAAAKAAKRLPSAASRVRSSWETAAPEIAGIGGSESASKHTEGAYEAAAYQAAMAQEQSHREEMSAAIRAQRERQGTAPRPKPPASPLARLVALLRGK